MSRFIWLLSLIEVGSKSVMGVLKGIAVVFLRLCFRA